MIFKPTSNNLENIYHWKNNCDWICEKGSYSLSNWMCLTIHCVTCKHGTNLKFGHLTHLTWFYFWTKFHFNRLNTVWVVTNQSWNLRKAIRPLFTDPVTIVVQRVQEMYRKFRQHISSRFTAPTYLSFDAGYSE